MKTHKVIALALGIFAIAPLAAQSQGKVVYLDQGWSQADRETYYWIPQGAQIIRYDIFLNLEAAGTQTLFRSDSVSEVYGLIPEPANPRTNPDALPIGLTKTVMTQGRWKGETVGLTCAACHNGQLNYKGTKIRVEGGVGNMFDFMAYIIAFDDAMQATLNDAAKFDRLAARMGATAPDAKSSLRATFAASAAQVHHMRTRILVTPVPWGPARMDAIAMIVNRLTSTEPAIPENFSTAMAPTKPPFMWNSPQGSWTQWRGVQQDPINRNLTETMGVFMPEDLLSNSPQEGLFESGAQLENLNKIERLLNRLAPPQWPEDVLGKIDRKKAAAGKVLFAAHCQSCHNQYPYTWTAPNKYGKRFIEVGLVPDTYVGTDPGQFRDLRPYAITGQLAPWLTAPFTGKEIIPTGALYNELQRLILAKALSTLTLTDSQAVEMHGYREFPLPTPVQGMYKAAPREGVWATPPFLHNGAVPNLYELLMPASQRTKKFYVGREFDPVRVGLDMSGKTGKFLLDTSLPGNSNAGHSFENGPLGHGVVGPMFTDAERWEIIEYLKSIPEKPGQITPFGGTPTSVTGHGKWAHPTAN